MSRVSNSSSYSSVDSIPIESNSNSDANSSPNYGKAALYIAIATVAAVAFTALLVCSGGSIVIAGFMFSIGLAIDGVAVLAGTLFLAMLTGFMGYETVRLGMKADVNLHPAGAFSSSSSSI